MSTIVLSGKAGVESASALAEKLGADYMNPYEAHNTNFEKYDVVFKYGVSGGVKTKKGATVLNRRASTEIAVDKTKTFETFKEEKFTVPYTTNLFDAAKWLKEGNSIVARTVVDGDNGKGVHYCDDAEDLLDIKDAKFYTKYIEHTNEFRVNVWRDRVVTVYNKDVKEGFFDFKLFEGVEEHPQLTAITKKVYEKTKLDWYGLDLLRDTEGNLFLLEINSAPILHPKTLTKLANIVKKEIIKK